MIVEHFLIVHRERGEQRAGLSLNFHPMPGALLLWAIQKSFNGGNKARAESLS